MSQAPWAQRPIEEARLLNPAFIGELVEACTRDHERESGQGLPYTLAFVAVPVVLHKATREALPGTTRTSLGSWLAAHPRVHVGFAERAAALVPFVKEAVLLSVNADRLAFAEARLLALRPARPPSRLRKEVTEEVRDCIVRAGFLGRWFARGGDSATIMTLWGVSP